MLTSGGSSGTRGIFVFDDRAIAEYSACTVRPAIARFDAFGGVPPEGIDIALVAAASPIHATAATSPITSGTGFRVHQIPATLPFDEVLARVADLDAPVPYGYPGVLARLARAQLDGRSSLRLLSVSCSSETMRPDLRAVMTEAWGVPQTNVFGSTESLVGSSEPGGEAIVFASDGCIVEAVDEHDRRPPRHRQDRPLRPSPPATVEANRDLTRNAKRPAPESGPLEIPRGTELELLDAETRDGSADDELLDLLGAFEDVHELPRSSILYHAVPLNCGLSALPCHPVQPEPARSVQL